MPESYAHALIAAARTHGAEQAVAGLARTLKGKGREKLLSRIARLVARHALVEERRPKELVVVASEERVPEAKKEAGLPNASVAVDPTLVGGWRSFAHGVLTDASYKRHLTNLFTRITA